MDSWTLKKGYPLIQINKEFTQNSTNLISNRNPKPSLISGYHNPLSGPDR